MNLRLGYFLSVLMLLFSVYLIAEDTTVEAIKDVPTEEMIRRVEVINKGYIVNVKPIFLNKCFDCHSNQTNYPWYHSLPLVRQLLDNDIVEGKKHIDMSEDFPFGGHGSIEDDLKAIQNSVNKDKMPPLNYRVMHPSSRLTEGDKVAINRWIRDSIEMLKAKLSKSQK